MPSVGDQLRLGRERRGLGVTEVANSTNIKSDYIRAMEAGDWSAFGAPVYIKGFVRTYATHLKLDAPAIVQQLEEELRADPDLAEPPPLTGPAHGPIDWAMLQFSKVKWSVVFPLLVGVGVVVAGYYGLKAFRRQAPRQGPAQQLGPGLHQRPRPVPVPNTLPIPTNTPPAPARR